MTEPITLPAPRPSQQGLDFVAVDVETANSVRGSVCAVGATVVRGGKVTQTESWLSRPPAQLNWFDPFNVMLHGITSGDVARAPSFTDSLERLLALVGGLPVVAHNAAFDVGALRDGCDAEGVPWPTLTYVCSLVLSRRALDLISYRLPLVAAELAVGLDRHHDAAGDSLAAANIMLALAERNGASSLHELTSRLGVLLGELRPSQWVGCRSQYASGRPSATLPSPNLDADPDHPLFGQVVVFTGALGIVRADAWDMVAAVGAIPEKGVTSRTTILVIGDGFIGDNPSDFATGKAAKAAAKRAKGQNIEVFTEEDLRKSLGETATRGIRSTEPA